MGKTINLKIEAEGVAFSLVAPGVYRAESLSPERGLCVKTLTAQPAGGWGAELRYADGTFSGDGKTFEAALRKAAVAAWTR